MLVSIVLGLGVTQLVVVVPGSAGGALLELRVERHYFDTSPLFFGFLAAAGAGITLAGTPYRQFELR